MSKNVQIYLNSNQQKRPSWCPLIPGTRSPRTVRIVFPRNGKVKKGHACVPIKIENIDGERGSYFKDVRIENIQPCTVETNKKIRGNLPDVKLEVKEEKQNSDQVLNDSRIVLEAKQTKPDTSNTSSPSNQSIEPNRESEAVPGLNTEGIFGGPDINPLLVKFYIDEMFKQNMSAFTAKMGRNLKSIYLPPPLQHPTVVKEITVEQILIKDQWKELNPQFALIKQELFSITGHNYHKQQAMPTPGDNSAAVEAQQQLAPAVERKRRLCREKAPIELENVAERENIEFVGRSIIPVEFVETFRKIRKEQLSDVHLLQPRILEKNGKRQLPPPVEGKKRIRAMSCANGFCGDRNCYSNMTERAVKPSQPTKPATASVLDPMNRILSTMAISNRVEAPSVKQSEHERLHMDDMKNQREQELKMQVKKNRRELSVDKKRRSQFVTESATTPTNIYSVQGGSRLYLQNYGFFN